MKQENYDPNSTVFAQQRKAGIKTFSMLCKLDKLVDSDKIFHLDGPLRSANLTDEIEFSIILP